MSKSKNAHTMEEKHNVRLSKALSWLLRHNIVQVNSLLIGFKLYWLYMHNYIPNKIS